MKSDIEILKLNTQGKMKIDNIVPLLMAMGSINAFVTMQVFVKLLSTHISTQYIIYLRSTILFILNSFFILRSSDYQPYLSIYSSPQQPIQSCAKYFSFNIKNRGHFEIMLKRQFWATVSINIFLSSLKYVNISVANALYNLTPVFTFFIEAAYYRKGMDKIKLLLTLFSFLGVFIILNPSLSFKGSNFDWHVLMPIVACLATCMNFLYLHEMRNSFKDIQVLQYTYTFQLLTSGLMVSMFGGVGSSSDALLEPLPIWKIAIYILCIASLAYISNYLRIKTLFKRKPSEVLAFNYTGIIYSIFLDIVLFKNNLHFLQIIGVLLTSTGLLSQFIMELFKGQ